MAAAGRCCWRLQVCHSLASAVKPFGVVRRLRRLAPFSSMRWARWTTRSRMASPKVMSPMISCQRDTGTWLVISSEPLS